jgi:hypothetical protein
MDDLLLRRFRADDLDKSSFDYSSKIIPYRATQPSSLGWHDVLSLFVRLDVVSAFFSVLSNTRLVECGKLEIIATEKSSRLLQTVLPFASSVLRNCHKRPSR